MSTNASALQVPSTREFSMAWIAYGCFVVGWFAWWPSLVGLIVCYAKRGDAQNGFIDTHYAWLIRTFWWSLLGYLMALGAVFAGIWPIVRDVLGGALRQGHWDSGATIQIDWSAILSTVGGATIGGLGFLFVWLWVVYRVVRGGLRLHAARAVP